MQQALRMAQNRMRTLYGARPWRHNGAMADSPPPSRVCDLDRLNLRLAPEAFAAIDTARAARHGSVSRNTWIAEAVQEKLAREGGLESAAGSAVRHA